MHCHLTPTAFQGRGDQLKSSTRPLECSSLKIKWVRAGILLSNSSGPLGPLAIVWVISEGPVVLWVCGLELRLKDLGNRYVGLGEKSADRLGFCL